MALVKTTKLGAPAPAKPEPAETTGRKPPAAKAPIAPRDRISERIASATQELASGLTEASAAAEELRRSMEQIAAGAEEAAGGAQEQSAAIKTIVASLDAARAQAEASRRRTEAVQLVLTEAAVQITSSVRSIERNAQRQSASVDLIAELKRRAQDIGEISQVVSRVSDQTNLLALNAAIEAARAGDHGRGFAVVAEEVRTLAETSERSAVEVQGLAQSIQVQVQGVVTTVGTAAERAAAEARTGGEAVETLEAIRQDMGRIADGSDDILTAAMEAERAASEAQRGASDVAAAAEEQSAAAAEAQTAIQQQATALDQGQTAALALAEVAEGLGQAQAGAASAEEIAATAEELSATIQELSTAASQILMAVDQINRGSQQQASATQQTSAALNQIESSANLAQKNAVLADERAGMMATALKDSRVAIERLVEGVIASVAATEGSLATIVELDSVGRRIEKIVDSIGLVAVQTTMLAVSGSVEAARAGEAGRGFAVVSSDIRSLARDASDSSGRIKETVRGVLDQIATLRRDLEQIIAAAELEVQANRNIAATLLKLDSDVAAMSAASRAILEGAQSIMSATVQASSGARQIAAAAEEASAAARQAAIASSQQARGAEDLAAAIEEIASLADALRQQNA